MDPMSFTVLRQVDFPNLRIAIAEYDQPLGELFEESEVVVASGLK